jgi:putative IMPACT (imprinted ancient) family translation regulator
MNEFKVKNFENIVENQTKEINELNQMSFDYDLLKTEFNVLKETKDKLMKEKLAGFSSNKEIEMNKSLDTQDIIQ